MDAAEHKIDADVGQNITKLYETFDLLNDVSKIIGLVRTGGTSSQLQDTADALVSRIKDCHEFIDTIPDTTDEDLERTLTELEVVAERQELTMRRLGMRRPDSIHE